MRAICPLVGLSVALAACADARGLVRVDQAAAGQPYDFVVHVKNSAEIGYNPDVASDRASMAMSLVKRYCRRPRVVGQQTIVTEIYGITSSKPDLLVFVSCER